MTALLHHHFQDDKTRITKDAAKLYAKYIDIFAREAVARAVYERKEKLETETIGTSRIQTMSDSYLEVRILRHLHYDTELTILVIGRRLGEVGSATVDGLLSASYWVFKDPTCVTIPL